MFDTPIVFLKEFFEKLNFEKKTNNKSMENYPGCELFVLFQVVLGKPVSEVAKNVIIWVRLPILTPEELEKLEKDNKKDSIIPVSIFSKYLE